MGFEAADRLDDGGKAALSISCSICLEDVTNYRDRGFAKLQCGHQFHLDCIGSAFNVKGVMQCPNCRKIEKGQWLYADNTPNSRVYTELHFDDLAEREDVYDLNYPESSMWCPFGDFSRIAGAVAIDEVEFPTTGYTEIIGQHIEFNDHSATVSSANHVCPVIAYVHPPSSSTNVGDNGDRYNNNNNYHNHYRWLYANAHADHLPSPTRTDVDYLPSPTRADVDYLPSPTRTHVDYLPLPTRANVDHLPSQTRTNVDMPTSGSYLHPFFTGQSSSTRGPSSINPVTNHPHPDSGTRAWERSQALEAYYQQPSVRRSNTQVHVSSSSDQTHGGYYPSSSRRFHDADNSMLHPFHHVSERDPPHPHSYPYPHETGTLHQAGSGSATQRRGSGRAPSRMQYWL
ncbi:uncharacterized protein LOC143559906 [Bidens hawaiensis]|uniref:uncharacterized protein LOC143559906 n=1 Tax=Bidens hawaiensis TaxID=980011 RepID=UPI004049E6AD